MDINDKIARCRLIASLIVADDNVEDAELELLERAMEGLDLSEEDKAKVMVLLDEEQAEAALETLTDDERLAFLDDLAAVAWVDGDLDDYERDMIIRVAGAMDLTEADANAALERKRP